MTNELWAQDATHLAEMIRTNKVSATEVVAAHVERLRVVNPKINAVVRDLGDAALKDAASADAAIKRGDAIGPLHGVPITTKINTDQSGLPTDNGVIAAKGLIAESDNPVIGTLRAAGAIVIGRTNAPAFSMRIVTDNALHGQTWNPWGKQSTCGGSSGGAGAALAVGIGALAQGNDIGGSIRWPAYCNGVVGLRPTVGRIASFNETAVRAAHRGFATQLMSVNGPMARSVRDIELALSIMAAPDPRDAAYVPAALKGAPTAKRVALLIEERIDAAVLATVRRAGAHLKSAGYEVVETSPPGMARMADLWSEIGLAEIGQLLMPIVLKIGDKNMERFFVDFWAAKGHRDIERYQAGLRERDTLIRNWQIFMAEHPLIIMPQSAEHYLAPDCDLKGASTTDQVLQAHRYQLAGALLGLPGLSVPMGVHAGLPIGVQVVAGKFREDLCLAAGSVIEAREGQITPIDPRF